MHEENAVSSVSDIIVSFHRLKYNLSMERLQAYKFELMPNGEQRKNMRRFAGACRYVYNRALSLQQESQSAEGGYIRYEEMAKRLPLWKSAFVAGNGMSPYKHKGK